MATIADVARAAGVSRSTVSHALSGKRPISEPTRQRIAEAIRQLGYIPSARGLALATSKSWAIGLSAPGLYDEFAAGNMPYVLAITKRARELGYDTLMVTDDNPIEGIKRVTLSDRVDGVICMTVTRQDPRITALAKSTCPAVILGSPVESQGVDVVDVDFEKAAILLVDHLAAQGHRRLILLTMPQRFFRQGMGYAVVFRAAVVRRVEELGLSIHCIEADTDVSWHSDSVAHAMERFPNATAFLVQNDALLIEIQHLLQEKGLRVPEDIAVVGIFSSALGKLVSLPYTEIETSAEMISAKAVDILVRRIEDPTASHIHELVAPVLIDRGTGKLPRRLKDDHGRPR